MDGEKFKREYHDLFYGDPKLLELQRDREKRMQPKPKDGRGSLEGFDKSKVGRKPTEDMLAALGGRLGGLGATKLSEPATDEVTTVRPSITPNVDGTLDVTVD